MRTSDSRRASLTDVPAGRTRVRFELSGTRLSVAQQLQKRVAEHRKSSTSSTISGYLAFILLTAMVISCGASVQKSSASWGYVSFAMFVAVFFVSLWGERVQPDITDSTRIEPLLGFFSSQAGGWKDSRPCNLVFYDVIFVPPSRELPPEFKGYARVRPFDLVWAEIGGETNSGLSWTAELRRRGNLREIDGTPGKNQRIEQRFEYHDQLNLKIKKRGDLALSSAQDIAPPGVLADDQGMWASLDSATVVVEGLFGSQKHLFDAGTLEDVLAWFLQEKAPATTVDADLEWCTPAT